MKLQLSDLHVNKPKWYLQDDDDNIDYNVDDYNDDGDNDDENLKEP